MILDSEFIISLKSQETSAISKARILEKSNVPLRIPAIVVYELYISVGKTPHVKYKTKDLRAYKRLIHSKPLVETNGEIAQRAGVLEGTHQRSDSKPNLGPADAIIAATAQFFNEPVVTSDGDFDEVSGVNVESY